MSLSDVAVAEELSELAGFFFYCLGLFVLVAVIILKKP